MTRFRVIGFLLCSAFFGPSASEAAEFCTDVSQCGPGQDCIGGGCVDPISSISDEVAAIMGRETSVVRLVQIPAVFDPEEECCFDLDGDGSIDDAYGTLLAALAGLIGDINGSLHSAVSDGLEIGIMDWRELDPALVSGDVQFSWYPFDWAGEQVYSTTVAGDAHVLVHSSAIGSHGSVNQFNDGGFTAPGFIDVSGNRISLPYINGSIGFVLVNLYQARMDAEIQMDTSPSAPCEGLCTVDEDRGGGHDPQIVGGARVGGLMSAAEVWTTADLLFRQCDCAGVDPFQPVITWAPSGGRLVPSCTSNTGGSPSGCENTPWCEQINLMCPSLTIQGQILDQDLDDDGVLDAWSVGLRIGFSGVTVDGDTGEIFVDGFATGDTTAWSDSSQ